MKYYAGNDLGQRIKQARMNRGWSQDELARQIGACDRHPVGTWEAGKRVPRIDLLAYTALALNVSSDWLLFGDDE